MSCKYRAMMAAALAGLAASGCAPVDVGLGEAHRYDMALQTIDPDPVYPEDGAKPGDSGVLAAEASERYRLGNATPVESMSISTGSTGSGGGPN